MTPRAWAGTVARGAAIVSVLFGIVATRVVWTSRAELIAASAADDAEERIVHLGRAARMYAPGNPYSERALERLVQAGRAGEPGASTRLAAWREVRAAILSTRSFYTPHAELLHEANGAIALEMARLEAPDAAAGPDHEQRRQWHAARLAQDDAPSVAWSVVALCGLGLWIGAAVAFIFLGLEPEGRIRRGRALVCLAGVLMGLAAFFIGLARA